MSWHEREEAPPGDFWSPPLVLSLSDGTFAFGKALLSSTGGVHTWFWDDEYHGSCSESCYDGVHVVGWNLKPTAEQVVLAGVFGNE